MHIRNAADTFQVGMVAHPEYDDRYWRYIENFQIESKNNDGKIVRKDSALWLIIAHGGESVLRYQVHLPVSSKPRAAWRPFLSRTGGLIGGPHTFMYIVGHTLAPSQVVLHLPQGWNIATGLQTSSNPMTFYAADAFALADCPILVGLFNKWQFNVDGVPHTVVYCKADSSKLFDTALLVSSIEKIVRQGGLLFGRVPYREYLFLLQDEAYGALEHANSVTVGVPSEQLPKYFNEYMLEIAHEFFHTWNLVRIRPAEWGDVSYIKPKLSRVLWWGEGLTMYYADLLMRRAGLTPEEPTRLSHLQQIFRQYFMNSGNYSLTPEEISVAENAPPGMSGDYIGSPHVQGEILGTLLDIIIRSNTNGLHTIDDVMRKMNERFSGANGYTGKDIETIIEGICNCEIHSFFEQHIRGKKQIDFNKYLEMIGLHMNVSWEQSVSDSGKTNPDLRVYAWVNQTGGLNLGIMDPLSCWGKAGLHTGDQLISINRSLTKNLNDFFPVVRKLKTGDHVEVEVKRGSKQFKTFVTISGYQTPKINLTTVPSPTLIQQQRFESWNNLK
jgi:predicted metalloprotease with PDZ domain